MEDEGSSGSRNAHFEKLSFGDELMVSDEVVNAKLSKMSLAVAKDSGFFDIDLSLGDYFTWGKASGCDLLQGKCQDLCDQSRSVSCDKTHRFRAKCEKLPLSDSCWIPQNMINCKSPNLKSSPVFSYGNESVCLETNPNVSSEIPGADCFKISCNSDQTYFIDLPGGNNNVPLKCSHENQKLQLEEYTLEITCAKFEIVCKDATPCQSDCHNK